ncbi:hypothetical protein VT84_14125 [Gemmata sp. SH-PL17]|uniref:hypothetical protein n=1 Tax=Gemmata sp. SH-PL17 TaxID=1630693 RepID=UPI00078B26B4|nr:hypothetical protein [Gemmata sp. SH-PL17]AMV25531.1 hypothetical protein VT84_14125 [Gemmata sp. SH-PL17]
MPIKDTRARTAARKAAGVDQTYPEHATGELRANARAIAVKPLPLSLVPCTHLGDRVPGQPCGSPMLKCNLYNDITTRFTACSGAQRCCAACPDNTSVAAPR